ncbi:N-acetyltransferase [Pseudoroseomonas cervicalis]|uniref:GNAT family N-acetyltransferase n=1 Tax=Teichococcus cervicalis TaxID=204525 RepID=UPI0022F14740|nr:GNAT family N-acetyltransferase [Pseudoroseomonas cervicalis]WBV42169.1 GNAT family N-acetyltransferase [Pseudoroseomonas cervicalis]
MLAERFEFIADNAGPEAASVRAGLAAHRAAALPARPDSAGGPPVSLVWRDAGGRIRAGLIGDVTLDWLFIDKFWVDETLRGQGIGRRMLAAAEERARALGAVGAHLYTSSFQAPDFYRARGYAEIGRLRGRPAGHDRLWFAKRWDGADSEISLP